MKKYLLFFFIIISYETLSQKISNTKNISINIVSKIDMSSGFDATDNRVGNQIIRSLASRGYESPEDPRYFITVSFGWRYIRTSELMINNFKGFIIDKNNSDKVVAEFSLDKIKDLEKSIEVLTENIISKNYLVSDNNKFIDVQDHFMKMNMEMWDSSRPDSHAPSGVDADHVHSKGGIMIGYKYNLSNGVGTYNDNNRFTSEEIYSYYQRDIISQTFNTHSLEMMYGVHKNLTLYTKVSLLNKKTIYDVLLNGNNNLISQGFGDIDFQALYSLFSKKNMKLHSNVGLVIPSGNINKKNKINIMPYSMQTGSGYFSVRMGFTYLFQLKKISGGLQPLYLVGLADNSVGYSYGNELNINYWLAVKITNFLSLSIRQNYINKKSISGEDSRLNRTLMILNNSNNSGEILLNTSFGLNLSMNKGLLRNSRVSFEYSFPSHMSYNGLQVGSFNHFILNLQYSPGGHKNH